MPHDVVKLPGQLQLVERHDVLQLRGMFLGVDAQPQRHCVRARRDEHRGQTEDQQPFRSKTEGWNRWVEETANQP